ncbi:MAG TPA: soluble NSF attachment family protein [Candidatus Rikenella faecigallinarum]|uniref:Soluble NSF attachment family protein n=1 Tax=Candidatus Rikenella faecigallinarum TaxID=2838745 RepID=A0A9D1QCA0_9BACT|nr:soluble NSF attachment family protein [Candidatus Rikenella faecigallinarum]
MAETAKNRQTQDPEQVIEQGLGRFELFIERNGKTMLIILGIIIVLVGGYFSYKYLYIAPRMEKASAAMFEAQNQFERDSFALALNGNASFDGFLTIADQYGNTPQGNLANHYAGLCYLYLGQYQEAVDAFEAYDAVKDNAAGNLIGAQNIGLTGDAYVEMGKLDEGAKYYEKAAAFSDNISTTPLYLKKAGLVNEKLGNLAKALEQYETIRNNYPQSMQARDIEKFIARVQQQM